MFYYIVTKNKTRYTVFMKKRYTHTLYLSIAYLLLEVTAFRFLSSIFTRDVGNELLSQYERFGYASAGIGAALLFYTVALNYSNKIPARVAGALFVPLIYMMSVWSLYEFVHKSPNYVPEDVRVEAARAGLMTLSKPDVNNVLLFYFSNTNKAKYIEAIPHIIENRAHEDEFIQAVYIQGIRNISAFKDYYESHANMLDKPFISEVWRNVSYHSYLKNKENFSETGMSRLIHEQYQWKSRQMRSPVQLPALALSSYLIKKEPLIKEHVDNLLTVKPGLATTKTADAGMTIARYKHEEAAWDLMRKEVPQLGHYISGSEREILDRLRYSYSQNVLSPFAYLPNASIPWANNVSPLRSETYNAALQQIAPFFMDKNGIPVLTIARIYDKDTYFGYINNLQLGLNPKLREQWSSYLSLSYQKLATDRNEWLVPTQFELHKDLLRIGAVVPIMLSLSALLILMNLLNLLRQGVISGVVAAAIVISAFTIQNEIFDEFLLDALLSISVKESQIYLY
jgi:hypothetical protein